MNQNPSAIEAAHAELLQRIATCKAELASLETARRSLEAVMNDQPGIAPQTLADKPSGPARGAIPAAVRKWLNQNEGATYTAVEITNAVHAQMPELSRSKIDSAVRQTLKNLVRSGYLENIGAAKYVRTGQAVESTHRGVTAAVMEALRDAAPNDVTLDALYDAVSERGHDISRERGAVVRNACFELATSGRIVRKAQGLYALPETS